MKGCPKCRMSTFEKFCAYCGAETVQLPHCNWCLEEFMYFMNNCPKCGRTKREATTTLPPPGKIKQFFTKLFGSEPVQKTVE